MSNGVCVEKLPHSCGTTQGLQVFQQDDGTYDAYCFKCGAYIADPYKDKPEGYAPVALTKSQEEIQEELDEILSCPSLALPDRKLRQETVEYFGVKIGLDEGDGRTPRLHYYPYTDENTGMLCGFKVRLIENKRMWSVGNQRGVHLFGWEQALKSGARKLYITEGEIDAMSLYQMMRDYSKTAQGGKYSHLIPAVCSLPHGAASAERDISRLLPKIQERFEEIIFVPDMDDAGQAAAEVLSRLLPDLSVAALPDKDVNECLMNGRSNACCAATMFNSKKVKNTRIIRGSSLREAAKKKPVMGLSWPWQGLTAATRGIRRGETYYFGAGVKMGKSEVVNAIAAHMITAHDMPIFLVKPEEAIAKTYQMLVGKVAHRIFHDPNKEFDEEAFDKAEPLVGDKALIQDVYQFVDWDTLKGDIRYVVKNEGVKDIFLDPVTCFTNQLTASEANEFLTNWAAELSAMSKDLDFTSYIFCHLKAPSQGSHERGAPVMSHQFAGSRAMMRSCNLMIGLEGNKDPELPMEERNVRTLSILEDREFGSSDRISLYWDYNTGSFNEIPRM